MSHSQAQQTLFVGPIKTVEALHATILTIRRIHTPTPNN
jgi:hypothetical protein